MIKIEEKYDFNSINKKIMEANSNIERNIDRFSADDRGFLSQNLLNALRTFVEYIAVKIYLAGKTETINYDNRTVRIALDYIKSRGRIKFIERFHYYLQISRSHYIENDDSAERLMLKYYKYLILLKDYMKIFYNIDILNNITDFPLDLDSTFSDYYKKVADVIKQVRINTSDQFIGDKYYVQKYNIKRVYEELKNRILELDDIDVEAKKLYIAFKGIRNITDIELHKNQLKIYINMKKHTLKDPLKLTKDISEIGHWRNGDYCIIIDKKDDIDNVIPLIKQSLKVNKK